MARVWSSGPTPRKVDDGRAALVPEPRRSLRAHSQGRDAERPVKTGEDCGYIPHSAHAPSHAFVSLPSRHVIVAMYPGHTFLLHSRPVCGGSTIISRAVPTFLHSPHYTHLTAHFSPHRIGCPYVDDSTCIHRHLLLSLDITSIPQFNSLVGANRLIIVT